MKKLFILAAVVVILFTMKYSKRKAPMNSLLLENVEALATGEQEGYYMCYGDGSLDCPISKHKVYMVSYGYSLE